MSQKRKGWIWGVWVIRGLGLYFPNRKKKAATEGDPSSFYPRRRVRGSATNGNISVMITKPASPPIKAAKINIIHYQLLRQGEDAKSASPIGMVDQPR